MVRYNEHSIKFLQLTGLQHVLQISLADIRPDRSIKKKKKGEKNMMTKLIKGLLPLNLLIADAIIFIIIETVRISKFSKPNIFFFFLKKKKVKTNIIKNLISSEKL